MNPFDNNPDFYTKDARKNRDYNPITHETLITKFERLLPPELVEGKTVLDLGCCLGAAGQWALFHGAKSYTGIDAQRDFVSKANELLSHWNEKYQVTHQDIRSFLEKATENSYDIVIASGVLQVFTDPQMIISHCCRLAKEMVSVEAILPPLVRSGQLDPHAKIIQLCKTASNFAGGDHKLTAFGSLLSKPALDFLFLQNGYMKTAMSLTPKYRTETKAFSIPLDGEALPFRYFERYTHAPNSTLKTLETAVIAGEGETELWKQRVFSSISTQSDQDVSPWVFDQKTADDFSSIAEKHIPNYHNVIDLSIDVIKNHHQDNPKIIDIGCATGETLSRLHQAGFTDIYGVDNSEAMLTIAKNNIPSAVLSLNDNFPTKHGTFDIIIANWTLHFIEKREEYIHDIYQHLNPGGLLILTEKSTFSNTTKQLYYDFKHQQGVSQKEIQEKEIKLQGVLTTAPVSWYLDVLDKTGFESTDIISARYGFVTYLSQKPK